MGRCVDVQRRLVNLHLLALVHFRRLNSSHRDRLACFPTVCSLCVPRLSHHLPVLYQAVPELCPFRLDVSEHSLDHLRTLGLDRRLLFRKRGQRCCNIRLDGLADLHVRVAYLPDVVDNASPRCVHLEDMFSTNVRKDPLQLCSPAVAKADQRLGIRLLNPEGNRGGRWEQNQITQTIPVRKRGVIKL